MGDVFTEFPKRPQSGIHGVCTQGVCKNRACHVFLAGLGAIEISWGSFWGHFAEPSGISPSPKKKQPILASILDYLAEPFWEAFRNHFGSVLEAEIYPRRKYQFPGKQISR